MRHHIDTTRSTFTPDVWAGIRALTAPGSSALTHNARNAPSAVNALIDQLGFGVLLVDGHGQVKLMNRLALTAVAAAAHLQIAGSVLVANDKAEASQLRAALVGAASGKRAFVQLIGRKHGQRSVVAVVPCNESALRDELRIDAMGDAVKDAATSALIALIFERPAEPAALTVTLFAQTYRLTPTEQRVLSDLCDGHAVNEIAERTGSAVATVRCHVRSLLEKTGCANMRALTCRVANLPPLMPMDFSGFSGARQALHS